MVLGYDGPTVSQFPDIGFAGIDHGLDREDHPFLEFDACAGFPVVQHLGIFMKMLSNAMTAEFADHRKTVLLGMSLDRMADVAERSAGFDDVDTFPQAFVGYIAEALGQGGNLADREHPAGVAIPAILDDGDVQIDNITLF